MWQAGEFVSFDCVASAKGGKPVGSSRDCQHGEGVFCSKEQPCTPCSQGGCQACVANSATSGNCFFEASIGPYCTDNGVVGPCTKCCS